MSNEMGLEWIKEQQARSNKMNEYYHLDERDTDPNHPHKGKFTGLYQEILIYEKWNKRFAPMS
jgi:hypothetical protein